ncbi:endonuclease MutS2 [Alicyclobacillaceae bacterium I2511]|nr:endonuclease MutS2 [Alicyclobacillaceae bacterium I2511]
MDERTLEVLEFDKVRRQIQAEALSPLGRERLDQMLPLANPKAAEDELSVVDEALRYLYRLGPLPFGGISDVRPLLNKAQVGGVLDPLAFNRLVNFIQGSRRVRQSLTGEELSTAFPKLTETVTNMVDALRVEQEIRKCIGEDGTVLDQASPELRRIRSQKRTLEQRARQQLEQALRTQQRYLQESIIALRGDSLCLAVKAEYKHMIPGIIHDVSASGATVFIEPHSVTQLAAEVRMLTELENREVERVLLALSGQVAAGADGLHQNVSALAHLDAWFAKAVYAKKNRCTQPRITRDGTWALQRARHPLLAYAQAVPMDLDLRSQQQMVVITGPNTGGKTVALKTVGLLTLLAMAGCFLTTEESSEVGWCDHVFADIGDEQSIEQSLSTFSSHLRNIVRMLADVTGNSLVLLDELGAGTDPAEGAALSIAILQHLKEGGTRVVATTHYAELKAFAFNEPAVVNASVEFDVQTLRPTYRMRIGIPGRSNALAIARRLGMPEVIVEQANGLLQEDDIHVEQLIADIEAARRDAEISRDKAHQDLEQAEQVLREITQQRAELAQTSQQIQARATVQAREIVEHARTEAERIISELRRKQAEGQGKDHELVALRKALENAAPGPSSSNSGPVKHLCKGEITVGSTVLVRSLGQQGEVIESSPSGSQVTVQLGPLRMKVSVKGVVLVSSPGLQIASPGGTRRPIPRSVPLQLDVRGNTVDEAIPHVDHFLDQASLNGLTRVTVIHGKGTGALRDGLRRYFAHHPHVHTWASGGPGEGGDGVTVVDLR